jgi:hypothetical protein
VVQLSVAGMVDRFASIAPRMLNLRGVAGEKLQGTVNIVPEDKYIFKALGARAREGKLKVGLSEGLEGGKRVYTLSVENLKSEAGSFNDIVVVQTDSPIQPEIEVRVFVYLRVAQPAEKKAQ